MFKHVKTVTNRAPEFLKAAYAHQAVDLIDHDGFVDDGELFITWSPKKWRTWLMGEHRIPRLCGVFDSLNAAILRARM